MIDPATRLLLPDHAAVADLGTFLGRAARLDAAGAVRLVAGGVPDGTGFLAVYACALHGSGGPTVIALRVLALTRPESLDITVPLDALREAVGRPTGPSPDLGRAHTLLVPARTAEAPWAAALPPRSGWLPGGELPADQVHAVARNGIAEIAAAVRAPADAAAVAGRRAAVWGAPPAGWESGPPAGAAFAAQAFGFLPAPSAPGPPGIVAIFRFGPWWRFSTPRGHVLARQPGVLTMLQAARSR